MLSGEQRLLLLRNGIILCRCGIPLVVKGSYNNVNPGKRKIVMKKPSVLANVAKSQIEV